jgi:hypothetical protein
MAAAHAAAAEVAAMAASQTKARAAAAELRRQEEDAKRVRVQQRGMGYSFTLAHDHASAEFSKRCGTTHSFASVKHVAFFGDGDGFFLSRDNGRSYWTGLPSGLSENLLREGKNVQGELTYAVGGAYGEYYATLSDGTSWWGGVTIASDRFTVLARDNNRTVSRVAFGTDEDGDTSWEI